MIISVTGGKGGTGKSFVATNLAVELAKKYSLVLADLDVEAPNDHILLGAKLQGEEQITVMFPFIDYSKCIKCGVCGRVCDTGAMLISREGLPYVIPRLCSGCSACYYACPAKAIISGKRVVGKSYITPVKIGEVNFTLVTGMLNEGEEHVAPVVVRSKRRALSLKAELYLIDTAAGTSNTVAAAMDKSRLVIAVTEPTPLGLHDLELILKVAEAIGIREKWVVINKVGIGPHDEHVKLAEKMGAEVVAEIPYSRDVVETYVEGAPIIASKPDTEIAAAFKYMAQRIAEVTG